MEALKRFLAGLLNPRSRIGQLCLATAAPRERVRGRLRPRDVLFNGPLMTREA